MKVAVDQVAILFKYCNGECWTLNLSVLKLSLMQKSQKMKEKLKVEITFLLRQDFFFE